MGIVRVKMSPQREKLRASHPVSALDRVKSTRKRKITMIESNHHDHMIESNPCDKVTSTSIKPSPGKVQCAPPGTAFKY